MKAQPLCQYPEREHQHAELQPCGKPAEFATNVGSERKPMHYCAKHGAMVERHFKLTKVNSTN